VAGAPPHQNPQAASALVLRHHSSGAHHHNPSIIIRKMEEFCEWQLLDHVQIKQVERRQDKKQLSFWLAHGAPILSHPLCWLGSRRVTIFL